MCPASWNQPVTSFPCAEETEKSQYSSPSSKRNRVDSGSLCSLKLFPFRVLLTFRPDVFLPKKRYGQSISIFKGSIFTGGLRSRCSPAAHTDYLARDVPNSSFSGRRSFDERVF